jgi:hypothetical protein
MGLCDVDRSMARAQTHKMLIMPSRLETVFDASPSRRTMTPGMPPPTALAVRQERGVEKIS